MSPLVNLRENCFVLASLHRARCVLETHILHHFTQIHDVLVGCMFRVPAQQGSEVEECRRKNVVVSVRVDANIQVSLAQFLPARVDKQPNMSKSRWFPAKCLVQLHVFRRGYKPLLSCVLAS